ncbi:MAG: Fic family protein [Chitinophagaceae bacterium]|jgi:hypothetical protein|nr:Fic family protein [Chitinophagaceae bacterium]
MTGKQRLVHQELNAIKLALQKYTHGASIEALMQASGLGLSLRTFQRRLALLKAQGEVILSGDTRSTLYHGTYFAPPEDIPMLYEPEVPYGENIYGLPLSEASAQILAMLNRPEAERNRVGYNRSFLENYVPDKTSYLTPAELARLAQMGSTARLNEPAGTHARQVLNRLLIDLSWNSSRLEGNTYSLLDTERLLNQGEFASQKTALEAQMILNHKDAIEFLVEAADEIGFNRYSLLNLHALLSNNLLPEPAASGRLRQKGVGIHQSVYSPLGVPQLIEAMFDLLLHKASAITNPFEQAFFVMVHLPYLQPFDDVNKRVSRLAVNIPLNRHNLAPLSFTDVPNEVYVKGILGIYELNRVELLKDVFLWAYERSCARYGSIRQKLGEPDPIRLTYRQEIRDLVAAVVTQQLDKRAAGGYISRVAAGLPVADQARFTEAVEVELMSLHEGNFARYRVRPSVFEAWRGVWG